MTKLPELVGIGLLVFLVACGGSVDSMDAATVQDAETIDETLSMERSLLGMERSPLSKALDLFDRSGRDSVVVEREVVKEVAVEAATQKAVARSGASSNGGAPLLQVAQRKVISTASVSLEVEVVRDAIEQVRIIAESVGGFVEHLDSGGGPVRQRASLTIRVPQEEFSATLERIEDLGSVQSTEQGSEDVSERFIDLKARLDSALREEKSLLALLSRANAVSEILAIERELGRIRADIERFQGQLNFLERRIALATITVSLALPDALFPEPPSARLRVEVTEVEDSARAAKELASSLDGAVDRVVTIVAKDTTRASLTARVYSADFQRMVEFLESAGEVSHKEVTEGPGDSGANPPKAPRPDAEIQAVFFNDRGDAGFAWIIGAVAALAGVALIAALSYGIGSRRRRASGEPVPAPVEVAPADNP